MNIVQIERQELSSNAPTFPVTPGGGLEAFIQELSLRVGHPTIDELDAQSLEEFAALMSQICAGDEYNPYQEMIIEDEYIYDPHLHYKPHG